MKTALGGAFGSLALGFALSPSPGVWLIRRVFAGDTKRTTAALVKHTPTGVVTIANEPYLDNDADAVLDVYVPAAGAAQPTLLPTIVWIHGGAWISGDKHDVVPYFQLIAARGFAVVALNFSLGPGKRYPTALHQVNDALAYLQRHAARFRIDVNNLVLAGDSSGAQLATQAAAVYTNPAYARRFTLTPALTPAQLKGVALYCGIFDLSGLTGVPGLFGWGTRVALWAYTGRRADDRNQALVEMSTVHFVTSDFPPAFISGGNADPLTDVQSKPFAARLAELGVPLTTRFFAADREPQLGHEYQFKLDVSDGGAALDDLLAFINARVGRTER